MGIKRIETAGWAVVTSLAVTIGLAEAQPTAGPPSSERGEKPWEAKRRQIQDRVGGVSQEILDLQELKKVVPPAIEEAVAAALAAAREAAQPLTDGKAAAAKRLVVPDKYPTIQDAINAAGPGDEVMVKPGVYFELLTMKDGVRLVSEQANGGSRPVAVEGARLKMPARTLRTVIDGSKSKPSSHGIIDFEPGLGRSTIVDGFTIQNLPKQDHHRPGHAHALNVRGASPVIMNCLIRRNGSTGIGNHVVYRDQGRPIASRDFRWANVIHQASPVIYNNIIRGNLGLGVGCNHFSSPFILGNEIFQNDDTALGADPSPGIGGQHGSFATIVGNIVHDNPGGGILCKAGAAQGAHPIDRPTHPAVRTNVVYGNGTIAPGIAARGAGSSDIPVRIQGNVVCDSGQTGIALSGASVAVVEDNVVVGSVMPGIVLNGATALKLDRNRVTGVKRGPGFLFADGATIRQMVGNAADSNAGPRFMLRGGTIGLTKTPRGTPGSSPADDATSKRLHGRDEG